MDNEVYEDVEVSDELQANQVVTTGDDAIIQAIADSNVNFMSGSLGIVGALGFVFGAILGTAYDRIFRK